MSPERPTCAAAADPLPRSFAECAGLPAERFLYHEAPMAILDRIIEVDPDHARCTCRTDEANPFFIPDVGVPCWAGVEFMAQCIAVSAGARAVLSGRPLPVGLLLGTMAFECRVDAFEAGCQYEASSSSVVRDEQGLSAFDCTLARDGETIATARLTVKELDGEADNLD